MEVRRTFLDSGGVSTGDAEGKARPRLVVRVQAGRRKLNRDAGPRGDPRRRRPHHAAEKSLRKPTATGTVPQTDTGGRVEQTKVRGRNHVKELGKTAP